MPVSFEYRLIRSDRKSISASVDADGTLLIRAPRRLPVRSVERFLTENEGRLCALIEKERLRRAALPVYSDEDIPALTARAQALLPPKLALYAERMGVRPAHLRITAAKKRFGSCNSKGHICFSCFLMLFPEEAIDYVVVHELAHLKEMNHSSRFYAIVKSILPDYKNREAILKGRVNQ